LRTYIYQIAPTHGTTLMMRQTVTQVRGLHVWEYMYCLQRDHFLIFCHVGSSACRLPCQRCHVLAKCSTSPGLQQSRAPCFLRAKNPLAPRIRNKNSSQVKSSLFLLVRRGESLMILLQCPFKRYRSWCACGTWHLAGWVRVWDAWERVGELATGRGSLSTLSCLVCSLRVS
jgi:hypothetical protein